MKKSQTLLGIVLIIMLLFLAACNNSTDEGLTPAPTSSPMVGTLVPYATSTFELISEQEKTPTLAPSPTPTPQVHVVALNETMISIAYQYGISLEALQNENPQANPYALIVGDELLIPYQEPQEEGSEATPPPEAVTLSDAVCQTESSEGIWCLWSATNPLETGTENILVEISISSANSSFKAVQTVTAPVNISLAGQRVPMGAFFSAQTLQENGLTAPYQVELTLLQALPLNNTAGRYVPIWFTDGNIQVNAEKSIAAITGSIALAENASPATTIWVVAGTYDAEGNLVGFRRWEQETNLTADTFLPVEFQVFAIGGQEIATVDLLLEARP